MSASQVVNAESFKCVQKKQKRLLLIADLAHITDIEVYADTLK